jgi:hypothetical protein
MSLVTVRKLARSCLTGAIEQELFSKYCPSAFELEILEACPLSNSVKAAQCRTRHARWPCVDLVAMLHSN